MSAKETELLYKDALATIWWHTETKCVELVGKGTAVSGQYRVLMEKILDLIRQKHARKLLSDVYEVEGLTGEDLVWTDTDWNPRFRQTGVRFSAVVAPKALGLHLSIDKMMGDEEVHAAGLVTRLFSEPDKAREWLDKQKG